MRNQSKHTPGKWEIRATSNDDDFAFEISSNNKEIAAVYNSSLAAIPDEQVIANAQRIVKAVNMHDELVECLDKFLSVTAKFPIDTQKVFKVNEMARELIKQAEQI